MHATDRLHAALATTTARGLKAFVRHVPPRGHGLRAVAQVERYIPPPNHLLRARHESGFMLDLDLRDTVQKSMYYRGVFEPAATALIRDALPRGGMLLDVGANAGHYTFVAAAKVGPDGHVHAVEASSLNAERLRKNLAFNSLEARVTLHQVAVADQEGEMRLQYSDGDSPHGMRFLDPKELADGELVRVTTIDALLPEGRPDVVKIDVEGADLRVLHGMAEMLRERPPQLVLVETMDHLLDRFGDSTAALVEFMAAHGYVGQPVPAPKEALSMSFRPR